MPPVLSVPRIPTYQELDQMSKRRELTNLLHWNRRRAPYELDRFMAAATEPQRFRHCSQLINSLHIHPARMPALFNVDARIYDTASHGALRSSQRCWRRRECLTAFASINDAIGLACTPEARLRALVQRARMFLDVREWARSDRTFGLAHLEHARAALEPSNNAPDYWPDWQRAQRELREALERRDEPPPHGVRPTAAALRPDDEATTLTPAGYNDRLVFIRTPWSDGLNDDRVHAARTFHAGDRIASMEPLCARFVRGHHTVLCHRCRRENGFELEPCASAGCPAMFCSARCRGDALALGGHEAECALAPLVALLPRLGPVVRLVAETFRCAADAAEWARFVRDADANPLLHTAFAYELDGGPLPRHHRARLLYGLAHWGRRRHGGQYYYHMLVATYVYKAFKHWTPVVVRCFRTAEARQLLKGFILRMLLVCEDNGRELWLEGGVRQTTRDGRQLEAGVRQPVLSGVWPVTAWLPQTCTPNVALYGDAQHRLHLVAVRTVRKGAVLTVNWAHGVDGNDGTARRHHVHHRRMFGGLDCACPRYGAGQMPFPNEKSPQRVSLKVKDAALWSLRRPEMKELHMQSREQLRQTCAEVCDFMKRYDTLYPCRELYEARQCMEALCEVLFGPASIERMDTRAVKQVEWGNGGEQETDDQPPVVEPVVDDRSEDAGRLVVELEQLAPGETISSAIGAERPKCVDVTEFFARDESDVEADWDDRDDEARDSWPGPTEREMYLNTRANSLNDFFQSQSQEI